MTRTLLTITLPALLRPLGLDVFIERTGPEWGFLDFDHVNHGEKVGREFWGLGLHIVV